MIALATEGTTQLFGRPAIIAGSGRRRGCPFNHNVRGLRAGITADRPQFFSDFGKVFMGANRPGAKVSQGALDWTFFLAMQGSLKGTLDCVAAFSETDFRPDLKAFTVPTLVIHGDDDQVVPFEVTGRAAAKAIPNARLQVYKGAPHGLCFTHKDQVSFIKG